MTDWKARAQAAEAQVNHYRSGVRDLAVWCESEALEAAGDAQTEGADELGALGAFNRVEAKLNELASSEPGLPEKQAPRIKRTDELVTECADAVAIAQNEGRGAWSTACSVIAAIERVWDGRSAQAERERVRKLRDDCTGKEVGVGAGQEREPGVDRPGNPTASVDSNLNPVEQFKRLRDELLGEGARDAAKAALASGGGPDASFTTRFNFTSLAADSAIRTILAAAWNHATGHAPFSLPADSNLDQGGEDARTEDPRPVVDPVSVPDLVSAGAAVDVGGGPENSTSPRSSSEEQRSSNPQAPGSNPGGGTEARGVTSRRNTSTQESKPPRPGNDGPGGPESRVTRAEVPAAPQQQTSHVEGGGVMTCSECGRLDCPWHMPDIDALAKAAAEIEAFEGVGIKEWSELLLALLESGYEINPCDPEDPTNTFGPGSNPSRLGEPASPSHSERPPGSSSSPSSPSQSYPSSSPGAQLEDAVEALLLEHASNAAGESFLPSGADVERLTARIVRACRSTQPVEDVIEELRKRAKAAKEKQRSYEDGSYGDARLLGKAQAYEHAAELAAQLLRKGHSDSGGEK